MEGRERAELLVTDCHKMAHAHAFVALWGGGGRLAELTIETMPVASPRLDRRLLQAARKVDRADDSMAETWRKVGRIAWKLGLPRPSYETIRIIVREHRRRRAEVHELLQPVLADLMQGRVSAWDVARAIEAANLMRAPP
jgi:hypothetical protein